MRRLIAFGTILTALLAGCLTQPARPADGPTPAPPVPVAPSPATPPAALPAPATPITGESATWPPKLQFDGVNGELRMGPFDHIFPVQWLDDGRLYLNLQHGEGAVLALAELPSGAVTELASRERGWYYENWTVLDGKAVLFSYGTHGDPRGLWLKQGDGAPTQLVEHGMYTRVSPAGTAAITYPRCGKGLFVDLDAGAVHDLETPDLCAALKLDAWSSDGARLVTQAPREDAIPGFRFFDATGRPVGSFHEPGYYSLIPAWSPDGQELAFLSIQIDQRYPGHPEAVFEPYVAPRLGVLDIAAGTARYFNLPDMVFTGVPLWSADGTRLAVTMGKAEVTTDPMPFTDVVQQQIATVDLTLGELQLVTEPTTRGDYLTPTGWSPSGSALTVEAVHRPTADTSYQVITLGGAPPIELPGKPVWLRDNLLAVVTHDSDRLLLVDATGSVRQQIARGREVKDPSPSPNGRYLAYTVDTLPGRVRHASDPPGQHVVIWPIPEN